MSPKWWYSLRCVKFLALDIESTVLIGSVIFAILSLKYCGMLYILDSKLFSLNRIVNLYFKMRWLCRNLQDCVSEADPRQPGRRSHSQQQRPNDHSCPNGQFRRPQEIQLLQLIAHWLSLLFRYRTLTIFITVSQCDRTEWDKMMTWICGSPYKVIDCTRRYVLTKLLSSLAWRAVGVCVICYYFFINYEMKFLRSRRKLFMICSLFLCLFFPKMSTYVYEG